jgi:large subunit ribosomal protein L11
MGEKKTLDALIDGGKATGGPPLGPTLGPLGVNVLAIVNKINELTKDYAGMKVPVKIIVDTETKAFDIEVGTPTTSALIVKELGVEKGSGNSLTEKIGDLKIESVLKIAKMKKDQLLSVTLKSGVKEILGCCVSMGVTVEGKEPKEIQKEVDQGTYDHLFKE